MEHTITAKKKMKQRKKSFFQKKVPYNPKKNKTKQNR
jgi:hypothetical protein